ncbi:MAG: hypothetical protein WA294_02555 [Acidobacteriaceae bacterium]
MVTLETVWQTGLTFPNVEKSTSFAEPALKVRGNLMACVPTNKAAEPNSILIRIDRNDRPALLAEDPNLYYAPDHYLGYDGVLVRLQHLTPEILHDLLAMAHKFVARKVPAARSSTRKSAPRKPETEARKGLALKSPFLFGPNPRQSKHPSSM